jgi:hypothetical protein
MAKKRTLGPMKTQATDRTATMPTQVQSAMPARTRMVSAAEAKISRLVSLRKQRQALKR